MPSDEYHLHPSLSLVLSLRINDHFLSQNQSNLVTCPIKDDMQVEESSLSNEIKLEESIPMSAKQLESIERVSL